MPARRQHGGYGLILCRVRGAVDRRKSSFYRLIDGARLSFEGKPKQPGLVIGALLFGIGWGVTGMCPGSAAVMLGEGKVITLAAGFGMLFGTWLYALMYERKLRRKQVLQSHSC